MPAGDAIREAKGMVEALAGRPPEAVSGVTQSESGWIVAFDVVELPRIPPSTDVMATFEVTLDGNGDLIEMARTRRYVRGRGDGD